MSAVKDFTIGDVQVGGGNALFVIAGPCVIESAEHCRFMATCLKEIAGEVGIPLVFKASFDKANRTALSSYRGPGLKSGLKILKRIREEIRVPVLTDIHETSQVGPAAAAVDCLQIPAFLCRQTDLLVAAAASGCCVNVKKGQFMAPWDMQNVVAKLRGVGGEKILLTERGSSFGYNNLVVDMRSLPVMRSFGCPVVYDITHSLQLPGGQGSVSGGQPEFIGCLARAGVAAGVDGVFMEVHDNPAAALSDGSNSLPLHQLKRLLLQLLRINEVVSSSEFPEESSK